MQRINHGILLRIVLVITSLGIIALGLNTGLGGIQTLGLRLPSGFIEIIDPGAYAVQDSNVRFYGGFFSAAGFVILYCAVRNLGKYSGVLKAIIIMVALGGLARLSALPFADGVTRSFILEVVYFPILYVWLTLATRSKPAD